MKQSLKGLLKNLFVFCIACLVFSAVSAQSLPMTAGGNSLSLTALQPAAKNEVVIPSKQSLDPNQLFSTPTATDKAAFGAISHQAMPMTPYQINKLKRMLTATKKAVATPAGTPPTPITSSLLVNLAPGATPPVILLQQGFITSMVFVDTAGHPWPIEGIDVGNPNAFNVQWQQGSATNVLLVEANTLFTYGNLAVKLKGLTTPVMLTLVPGQKSVDYRVDIHVQGRSPLAPDASGSSLPSQASNVLLNVLNAIPPTGAKTLTVTGGSCSTMSNNCQAWYANNQLYVRIPMAILSPGWMSQMQSSDGMHAYVMQKTPSLLVSDYGSTTTLQIKGY